MLGAKWGDVVQNVVTVSGDFRGVIDEPMGRNRVQSESIKRSFPMGTNPRPNPIPHPQPNPDPRPVPDPAGPVPRQ